MLRIAKPLTELTADKACQASRRVEASAPICRENPFARGREGRRLQDGRTAMRQEDLPENAGVEFADDLLIGADAIARFLFGENGSRRKVYYLAETSHLPVFRLGAVLCARKSVLLKWISGQETRVKPPLHETSSPRTS
jgi:hypothetical protein